MAGCGVERGAKVLSEERGVLSGLVQRGKSAALAQIVGPAHCGVLR